MKRVIGLKPETFEKLEELVKGVLDSQSDGASAYWSEDEPDARGRPPGLLGRSRAGSQPRSAALFRHARAVARDALRVLRTLDTIRIEGVA